MTVHRPDASPVVGRGSIGALRFIRRPGPIRQRTFPSIVGPDRALLAIWHILAARVPRLTARRAPAAPRPFPSARPSQNAVPYSSPTMQVRANKQMQLTKRVATFGRPAARASIACWRFAADLQRSPHEMNHAACFRSQTPVTQ